MRITLLSKWSNLPDIDFKTHQLSLTITAGCPIHTPALSVDEWDIRAKARTAFFVTTQ